MIKNIITILIVCVFGLIAHAQNPDLNIGGKIGLNISNAQDIGYSTSPRYSIHVGAIVEKFVSHKLAIQSEFILSGQGFKIDDTSYVQENVNNKIVANTKINYINVPLLAKYYVWKGLNIQVGPQLGFMASAKTKVDTYILNGKEVSDIKRHEFEDSIEKKLNTFDFSFNVGIGYMLLSDVFVDIRYNMGLTNANKEEPYYKNGVLQISIGANF